MVPQHTRPLWLGVLLTPLVMSSPLLLFSVFMTLLNWDDRALSQLRFAIAIFVASSIGFAILIILTIPITYWVRAKYQLTYSAAAIVGILLGFSLGVDASGNLFPSALITALIGLITSTVFSSIIGVKKVW